MRRVKIHPSYTVDEAARLFGVHKNTVRAWRKSGLQTIDDRRPILVLGRHLAKFLHDRRQRTTLASRSWASVDYYDPHVPIIPDTRHYRALAGRASRPWGDFSSYDAVLIATDHDDIDYAELAKTASLIVDTRNACRRAGVRSTNVVGA